MKDLKAIWTRIKEMPDEDVPTIKGLGLGVNPLAKRWALLGYLYSITLDGPPKKLGAPSKGSRGSKDSYRAFVLWRIAQNLDPELRKEISNRSLVELASQIEDFLGTPIRERAFAAGNFDASISRGKRNLEISDGWVSKVCEEIEEN